MLLTPRHHAVFWGSESGPHLLTSHGIALWGGQELGQFGSGQDPPAGICSDIWLSHVSWPDEAFPPQTALFRPPTPQDGPRLGRNYSSLLRSQHPHHRKGGSVTELEKRRTLVNNEDKVS